MNAAVVGKTLRDARLLLIVCTAGLVVFEMLLVRMLLEAVRDMEMLRAWLERPLIKTLVTLALGGDLDVAFTATSLATVGLAHPVVYAVGWGLLVALATGAVAGEVGRGTADLLLTLPVARWRVYVSTSAGWVLASFLMAAAPLVGLWLGQVACPLDEPFDMKLLGLVAINYWALSVCVGGVTMLISSVTSRRGTAVGVIVAILLVSDVVNLVAQFWEAARFVSFLGFLHYYRPLGIVQNGALPMGHLAVLVAMALAAWLAGLAWFCRRDVPAG